MTAPARIIPVAENRRDRGRARLAVPHSQAYVSRVALEEAFEDVQLNAVADDRADGSFVRVSLDDL